MNKEELETLNAKLKVGGELTYEELVYQFINYAGYTKPAAEIRAKRYISNKNELKIIEKKIDEDIDLTEEEYIFWTVEEMGGTRENAMHTLAITRNTNPNRIVD